MKTYSPKSSQITRQWHLIDAKDQILGRLSSEVAKKLIGKHKTYYTAHLDCGDYVVVINAKNIKTTGTKEQNKIYYRHSGFPGGLKSQTLSELRQKHPTRVIENSVKGMIPQNKLRTGRLNRLKVFEDNNHPYADKFKSETTK